MPKKYIEKVFQNIDEQQPLRQLLAVIGFEASFVSTKTRKSNHWSYGLTARRVNTCGGEVTITFTLWAAEETIAAGPQSDSIGRSIAASPSVLAYFSFCTSTSL